MVRHEISRVPMDKSPNNNHHNSMNPSAFNAYNQSNHQNQGGQGQGDRERKQTNRLLQVSIRYMMCICACYEASDVS